MLLIFPDHLIGARWCLFVFLDPGSRVGLVYPRSCRLMHVSFLTPASFLLLVYIFLLAVALFLKVIG